MTKKIVQEMLKTISVILILAFGVQDLSYAAAGMKPSEWSFFEKPSFDLQIPESIATIEDVYFAPSLRAQRSNLTDEIASGTASPRNDKIVYLIQDAHTNESGQVNLAKTLDIFFQNDKNLKYVFVEAGSGDDSLSSFRDKAPLEKRKQVANSLLKRGLLHGAEYLDLTSDREFFVWGVEDFSLYAKALEAYRRVATQREGFGDYLKSVASAVETLKPRLYNPALLQFDKIYQSSFTKASEDAKISLTDSIEQLYGEAQKWGIDLQFYPHLHVLRSLKIQESEIDFKKANEEQIQAIQNLPETERKELIDLARKSPSKLGAGDHQEQRAFYVLLEEKIRNQRVIASPEGAKQSMRQRLLRRRFAPPRNDKAYPELFKYFHYLKEAKKISPKEILKEKENLESEIFNFLTKTSDEKTLLKCDGQIQALRKLFNFTLTPEEFEEYKNQAVIASPEGAKPRHQTTGGSADNLWRKSLIATQPSAARDDTSGRFMIAHLTGFLNRKIMDLKNFYERASFLEPGFEEMVQNAETFYSLTKDRDEAFVRNMLEKMDREWQIADGGSAIQNPQSAIQHAALITGGFHTTNLKSLLRKNNISYVSITPQILRETNKKRYEKILLGQKLENLNLPKPVAANTIDFVYARQGTPVLKELNVLTIPMAQMSHGAGAATEKQTLQHIYIYKYVGRSINAIKRFARALVHKLKNWTRMAASVGVRQQHMLPSSIADRFSPRIIVSQQQVLSPSTGARLAGTTRRYMLWFLSTVVFVNPAALLAQNPAMPKPKPAAPRAVQERVESRPRLFKDIFYESLRFFRFDEEARERGAHQLVPFGRQAAEALLQRLDEPDTDVQEGVLHALRDILEANPDLKSLYVSRFLDLSRLLGHGDSRVKSMAVDIIGLSEDPRGVPLLIPLLEDVYGRVRIFVMAALGNIGSIESLGPLLSLQGPRYSRHAEALAGIFRKNGPVVVARILAAFDGANEAQTIRYIKGLGEIGDAAAVPELLRQFEGRSRGWGRVQHHAGEALIKINSAAAVEPLKKLIETGNESVQAAAADTLSEMTIPAANETLFELLGHPDLAVRKVVVEKLSDRIYFSMDYPEKLIPVYRRHATRFYKALKDADPHVRYHALRALVHFAGAESLPHVLPFLGEKDGTVRSLVLKILKRFGDETVRKKIIESETKSDAGNFWMGDVLESFRERNMPGTVQILIEAAKSAALVPLLARLLLKEKEYRSARAMAEALSNIGTPEAKQSLIRAYREVEDRETHGMIAYYLSDLGTGILSDLIPAVKDAEQPLSDDDFARVAEVLGPKAIEELQRFWADPDPRVKQAVRTAVSTMIDRGDMYAVLSGFEGHDYLNRVKKYGWTLSHLQQLLELAMETRLYDAILDHIPAFRWNPTTFDYVMRAIRAALDESNYRPVIEKAPLEREQVWPYVERALRMAQDAKDHLTILEAMASLVKEPRARGFVNWALERRISSVRALVELALQKGDYFVIDLLQKGIGEAPVLEALKMALVERDWDVIRRAIPVLRNFAGAAPYFDLAFEGEIPEWHDFAVLRWAAVSKRAAKLKRVFFSEDGAYKRHGAQILNDLLRDRNEVDSDSIVRQLAEREAGYLATLAEDKHRLQMDPDLRLVDLNGASAKTLYAVLASGKLEKAFDAVFARFEAQRQREAINIEAFKALLGEVPWLRFTKQAGPKRVPGAGARLAAVEEGEFVTYIREVKKEVEDLDSPEDPFVRIIRQLAGTFLQQYDAIKEILPEGRQMIALVLAYVSSSAYVSIIDDESLDNDPVIQALKNTPFEDFAKTVLRTLGVIESVVKWQPYTVDPKSRILFQPVLASLFTTLKELHVLPKRNGKNISIGEVEKQIINGQVPYDLFTAEKVHELGDYYLTKPVPLKVIELLVLLSDPRAALYDVIPQPIFLALLANPLHGLSIPDSELLSSHAATGSRLSEAKGRADALRFLAHGGPASTKERGGPPSAARLSSVAPAGSEGGRLAEGRLLPFDVRIKKLMAEGWRRDEILAELGTTISIYKSFQRGEGGGGGVNLQARRQILDALDRLEAKPTPNSLQAPIRERLATLVERGFNDTEIRDATGVVSRYFLPFLKGQALRDRKALKKIEEGIEKLEAGRSSAEEAKALKARVERTLEVIRPYLERGFGLEETARYAGIHRSTLEKALNGSDIEPETLQGLDRALPRLDLQEKAMERLRLRIKKVLKDFHWADFAASAKTGRKQLHVFLAGWLPTPKMRAKYRKAAGNYSRRKPVRSTLTDLRVRARRWIGHGYTLPDLEKESGAGLRSLARFMNGELLPLLTVKKIEEGIGRLEGTPEHRRASARLRGRVRHLEKAGYDRLDIAFRSGIPIAHLKRLMNGRLFDADSSEKLETTLPEFESRGSPKLFIGSLRGRFQKLERRGFTKSDLRRAAKSSEKTVDKMTAGEAPAFEAALRLEQAIENLEAQSAAAPSAGVLRRRQAALLKDGISEREIASKSEVSPETVRRFDAGVTLERGTLANLDKGVSALENEKGTPQSDLKKDIRRLLDGAFTPRDLIGGTKVSVQLFQKFLDGVPAHPNTFAKLRAKADTLLKEPKPRVLQNRAIRRARLLLEGGYQIQKIVSASGASASVFYRMMKGGHVDFTLLKAMQRGIQGMGLSMSPAKTQARVRARFARVLETGVTQNTVSEFSGVAPRVLKKFWEGGLVNQETANKLNLGLDKLLVELPQAEIERRRAQGRSLSAISRRVGVSEENIQIILDREPVRESLSLRILLLAQRARKKRERAKWLALMRQGRLMGKGHLSRLWASLRSLEEKNTFDKRNSIIDRYEETIERIGNLEDAQQIISDLRQEKDRLFSEDSFPEDRKLYGRFLHHLAGFIEALETEPVRFGSEIESSGVSDGLAQELRRAGLPFIAEKIRLAVLAARERDRMLASSLATDQAHLERLTAGYLVGDVMALIELNRLARVNPEGMELFFKSVRSGQADAPNVRAFLETDKGSDFISNLDLLRRKASVPMPAPVPTGARLSVAPGVLRTLNAKLTAEKTTMLTSVNMNSGRKKLSDRQIQTPVIDHGSEVFQETQTQKAGYFDNLRDVMAYHLNIHRGDVLNPHARNRDKRHMDFPVRRNNGNSLPASPDFYADAFKNVPGNHRYHGSGVQNKVYFGKIGRPHDLNAWNNDAAVFGIEPNSQRLRKMMWYFLGSKGPANVMYAPLGPPVFLAINRISLWRFLAWQTTSPLSLLNASQSPLYFLFAVLSFISSPFFSENNTVLTRNQVYLVGMLLSSIGSAGARLANGGATLESLMDELEGVRVSRKSGAANGARLANNYLEWLTIRIRMFGQRDGDGRSFESEFDAQLSWENARLNLEGDFEKNPGYRFLYEALESRKSKQDLRDERLQNLFDCIERLKSSIKIKHQGNFKRALEDLISILGHDRLSSSLLGRITFKKLYWWLEDDKKPEERLKLRIDKVFDDFPLIIRSQGARLSSTLKGSNFIKYLDLLRRKASVPIPAPVPTGARLGATRPRQPDADSSGMLTRVNTGLSDGLGGRLSRKQEDLRAKLEKEKEHLSRRFRIALDEIRTFESRMDFNRKNRANDPARRQIIRRRSRAAKLERRISKINQSLSEIKIAQNNSITGSRLAGKQFGAQSPAKWLWDRLAVLQKKPNVGRRSITPERMHLHTLKLLDELNFFLEFLGGPESAIDNDTFQAVTQDVITDALLIKKEETVRLGILWNRARREIVKRIGEHYGLSLSLFYALKQSQLAGLMNQQGENLLRDMQKRYPYALSSLQQEIPLAFPVPMTHARRQVSPKSVPRTMFDKDIKAMRHGLSTTLDEVLSTLSPREERIIRKRFFQGLTQKNVALQEGVVRGRIWQIEAKAIRKLRHPLRAEKLYPFYEEMAPRGARVAENQKLHLIQKPEKLFSGNSGGNFQGAGFLNGDFAMVSGNELGSPPTLAFGTLHVAVLLQNFIQSSHPLAFFKEKTHRLLAPATSLIHRISAAGNGELGTKTDVRRILPKNQDGVPDTHGQIIPHSKASGEFDIAGARLGEQSVLTRVNMTDGRPADGIADRDPLSAILNPQSAIQSLDEAIDYFLARAAREHQPALLLKGGREITIQTGGGGLNRYQVHLDRRNEKERPVVLVRRLKANNEAVASALNLVSGLDRNIPVIQNVPLGIFGNSRARFQLAALQAKREDPKLFFRVPDLEFVNENLAELAEKFPDFARELGALFVDENLYRALKAQGAGEVNWWVLGEDRPKGLAMPLAVPEEGEAVSYAGIISVASALGRSNVQLGQPLDRHIEEAYEMLVGADVDEGVLRRILLGTIPDQSIPRQFVIRPRIVFIQGAERVLTAAARMA